MQDFFEDFCKFLSRERDGTAVMKWRKNTFTTGDTEEHRRSELQFPGFGYEVLAAPAVVALFGYELESCVLVDATGRG